MRYIRSEYINIRGDIIMTTKRNLLCTGLCTATLLLVGTAGAMAQKTTRVPNDPAVGGQLNRCWGEIASQLAQMDTSDSLANGGGMGQHSKDNQAKGTTFRDNPLFGGTAEGGRAGLGNGTSGTNGPHQMATGDGGLGQHAINNGTTTTDAQIHNRDGSISTSGFSNLADPVTGAFLTAPPDYTLECSLAPSNQVP
jgi:hypothetical protein